MVIIINIIVHNTLILTGCFQSESSISISQTDNTCAIRIHRLSHMTFVKSKVDVYYLVNVR